MNPKLLLDEDVHLQLAKALRNRDLTQYTYRKSIEKENLMKSNYCLQKVNRDV
jgi:hypothetical protein